jgi:hypothetical protein
LRIARKISLIVERIAATLGKTALERMVERIATLVGLVAKFFLWLC